MKLNKLGLLIFLVANTLMLSAQSTTIKGIVSDTLQQPLTGATVVLLQQSDSVMTSFSITADDGDFTLSDINAGDYILQITFLGYQNYSQPFTLKVNKKEQFIGIIPLRPQGKLLDEVVIKAEHVPMSIKNDTIEYNAAAYKVKPNAAVEDLLKKMPGIAVNRDGSVTAQGEQVEKVLVDGKEFFGNDPTIATQNLPADAVNKVQVFDEKSETAEFTGIEDGQRSKTLNLTLKEDKKKGYFGNITGGYGTDNRYEGKLNLNRFSNDFQLSTIGRLNNINEQGFSINDYINFLGGLQNLMSGGGGQLRLQMGGNGGVPLGLGFEDGFITSGAGGINMNYDISPKTEVSTNYFYNQIDNLTERTVNQQNFVDANTVFNNQESSIQNTQNQNHRLNVGFRYKIDSMQDLRIRTSVGYNAADLTSTSNSETFNPQSILENGSRNDYTSDGENFLWNNTVTYRRKFKKKGRAFVATGQFNLSQDDASSSLKAINDFYGTINFSDTIHQIQIRNNNASDYLGRLTYTEPIGKRQYLEFKYTHQNYQNEQIKDFFDIVAGDNIGIKNTELSNHFERTYFYDRGGVNYKYNTRKSNLTVGVSLQNAQLNGNLLSQEIEINRNFSNILPNLQFRREFGAAKSLSLNYNTNIREPNLEQLSPVINNSDPLNIYIGNPNLRPEYVHEVNTNFILFDQFSMTNVFLMLNASYTENKITNSRVIDSLFRQTIQPINVDNQLDVYGNFSFGTPLRSIKSKINIEGDFNYGQGIVFVNNIQNDVDNWNSTLDISLENRKKDKIDVIIGASLQFNSAQYSISEDLNQQFFRTSYYADLSWNISDAWFLTSGLDYKIYSAEAFGERQTIPIWKGSVSHFILDNRLELKLSAFDILNRNQGIRRQANLNFVREEQIATLGRYVMLSVAYSLSGFKKDAERGGITVKQRR